MSQSKLDGALSSERPSHVRDSAPSDGSPWMTPAAYEAAQGWRVPKYDGGCQLEWHQNGWDVEVDFSADGKLKDFYIGRSDSEAEDDR